ncbi:MAG: hypothetical protein ACYCSQ_05285 [bacterium]
MNRKLIAKYVEEAYADYEKNGSDKPIDEWFKEAIVRLVPGTTEVDALKVAKELLEGLYKYRELKENPSGDYKETLKEKGLNDDEIDKLEAKLEPQQNALIEYMVKDEGGQNG